MSEVKLRLGLVCEVYLVGAAVMVGIGVLHGMGVPPVYAGLLLLARVPVKLPMATSE